MIVKYNAFRRRLAVLSRLVNAVRLRLSSGFRMRAGESTDLPSVALDAEEPGCQAAERVIGINGKKYVLRGDEYLFRMGSDFEPGLSRLFNAIRASVSDGACLDVGANIGLTSILLSCLYDQVYCFEASPRAYAVLVSNLRSNGILNVEPHGYGLGESSQKLRLVAAANDASGGFISNSLDTELSGHISEQVDIRIGDEVLASLEMMEVTGAISFIKIDVEGFELDVLRGLRLALEFHKPVVVLELNHWCLNAFRRMSVPDFLEELDRQFPLILAYDDASSRLVDISRSNAENRYHVMHQHIVHHQYPTLIGLFEQQISDDIRSSLSGQPCG